MSTFQKKFDLATINTNTNLNLNAKRYLEQYSFTILDQLTEGKLTQRLQQTSIKPLNIEASFMLNKISSLHHIFNLPAKMIQENNLKKITQTLLNTLSKKVKSDIIISIQGNLKKTNIGIYECTSSIGLNILSLQKIKLFQISGSIMFIQKKIIDTIIFLLNQNILGQKKSENKEIKYERK